MSTTVPGGRYITADGVLRNAHGDPIVEEAIVTQPAAAAAAAEAEAAAEAIAAPAPIVVEEEGGGHVGPPPQMELPLKSEPHKQSEAQKQTAKKRKGGAA